MAKNLVGPPSYLGEGGCPKDGGVRALSRCLYYETRNK